MPYSLLTSIGLYFTLSIVLSQQFFINFEKFHAPRMALARTKLGQKITFNVPAVYDGLGRL